MVKKEEYVSCLYQLFNLPLEIIEKIVFHLYTHQFQTPLELRSALENYPQSKLRYGDSNRWDVSKIRDMTLLFANLNFTGEISLWDTSQVKNMQGMFFKSKFMGDISGWSVENVINFDNMFADSNFIGDLSKWNFKSAQNRCFMFYNTENPDQIKLSPEKLKDSVVQLFMFTTNLHGKIQLKNNHIICVENNHKLQIPSRTFNSQVYLYNAEYYNYNQDFEQQRITKSAVRLGYLTDEEYEELLHANLNYLT